MADEGSFFSYREGGLLSPVDDPERPGEGFVKAMARLGFHLNTTFGDRDAYGVEVWCHHADPIWWISICDGSRYCLVHVEGWPAYLDAMIRYAPIALMSKCQE